MVKEAVPKPVLRRKDPPRYGTEEEKGKAHSYNRFLTALVGKKTSIIVSIVQEVRIDSSGDLDERRFIQIDLLKTEKSPLVCGNEGGDLA